MTSPQQKPTTPAPQPNPAIDELKAINAHMRTSNELQRANNETLEKLLKKVNKLEQELALRIAIGVIGSLVLMTVISTLFSLFIARGF